MVTPQETLQSSEEAKLKKLVAPENVDVETAVDTVEKKPTFKSLEKMKGQTVTLLLSTNEVFTGKLTEVSKGQNEAEEDDFLIIEAGEESGKMIFIKDILTATSTEKKPNYATISLAQGVGMGTNTEKPFSATRISMYGEFGKTKTSAFGFVDLDGNPLKSKGFGKFWVTQQTYKGLNMDAVYTFTGAGQNKVHFGISYAGQLGKNEKALGYKFTIFPISTGGKEFTVNLGLNKGLGKAGELSSFVNVDFLGDNFYGETQRTKTLGKKDLAAHLAAFVQARYGGFKPEEGKTEGFIQGVTGLRLKIN